MNALVFSSLAVPKNEPGEKLIAVMGPTGAGKSSYIHDSAPPGSASHIKVGHTLQSETFQVETVSWATGDDTRIKLVDTPGFDDSREGVTDAEVLNMIATFLANEYGKKSQLTGLIYVHRISDPRVGGASRRNLRLFRKLCGTDSLKNVVIVTTMWDKVTSEEGSRREHELMTAKNLFKPLLDGGAIMMRHERTPESANKVINHLLGKSATTAQIVREILQEKKTLETTAAGDELHSDIEELMKKHKLEMESFKAEMKRMAESELAEERQKMNLKLAKLMTELDELKRGITAPIVSDPSPDNQSASDIPAPDPMCVVRYAGLLRSLQMQQSILASAHPELLASVTSRATRFADAVEKSVNDVQHGLSMLKPESMQSFQQLMKADPHPRSFTHGVWTRARYDVEIATNEVKIILSTKNGSWWSRNVMRNGKTKRADALNTILSSMEEVIAHMETMVKWWTTVIDSLAKIEDTIHCAEVAFDDDAINVLLTRIIRALGSYCDTYAKSPEDIRTAASGLPCN